MESISIHKYRIKKRIYVNNDGKEEIRYYPQYKSKLYGWRFMFKKYRNLYEKSTLLPFMHPVLPFFGIFSIFIFCISLSFLVMGKIIALIPLFSIILLSYITFKVANYYSNEKKFFHCEEDAKRFISERINRIIEEINLKKKKTISKFRDDEIIYLSLKVERKEKLKRLKRKMKFKK